MRDTKNLKKRGKEFYERCQCEEFNKQYEIIKNCVEKALEQWIQNQLTQYTLKDFETVCGITSNEISAGIIINKPIDSKMIAQSLFEDCLDEFDNEGFSAEYWTETAINIADNLSEALPEKSRFVLPQHLWSYWDDYWDNYNKQQYRCLEKKGLFLEKPDYAFIPWKITVDKLKKELEHFDLKEITNSYYCVNATAFCGLECIIGLHFDKSGIKFFEVFKDKEYFKNHTLEDSYNEIQKHLELTFGKPKSTKTGDAGFDSHVWKIGKRKVKHYVFERFGPEEHCHIERK